MADITISVSAATLVLGDATVVYNAMATVVTQQRGTTVVYQLYVDDPYYTGGSRPMFATVDPTDLFRSNGRVWIGQVRVVAPVAGPATGVGVSGGGSGGPYLSASETTTSPGVDPSLVQLSSAETTRQAPFGTPVYASGADTFLLAEATGRAKGTVIGLVADANAAPGANAAVKQDGVLAGSTAQWDAVVGTSGGLTADSYYFLSATPGRISATPLDNTQYGFVNTVLGVALSSTEMKLLLRDPILL